MVGWAGKQTWGSKGVWLLLPEVNFLYSNRYQKWLALARQALSESETVHPHHHTTGLYPRACLWFCSFNSPVLPQLRCLHSSISFTSPVLSKSHARLQALFLSQLPFFSKSSVSSATPVLSTSSVSSASFALYTRSFPPQIQCPAHTIPKKSSPCSACRRN